MNIFKKSIYTLKLSLLVLCPFSVFISLNTYGSLGEQGQDVVSTLPVQVLEQDMLGLGGNKFTAADVEEMYERDRQLEQKEFELRNEEMRQKLRIKKEAMGALLDVKKIKFEEEKRQHAAKMDLQKQLRALNREKAEYMIKLEEEKANKHLNENQARGFEKQFQNYQRLYRDELRRAREETNHDDTLIEFTPPEKVWEGGKVVCVKPGRVTIKKKTSYTAWAFAIFVVLSSLFKILFGIGKKSPTSTRKTT